ncbi:MAG: hypothetical protein NTX25_09770 [Proteobacteria bacterium]|nr:hypothetical protein [Pseudomonadota bacterium]
MLKLLLAGILPVLISCVSEPNSEFRPISEVSSVPGTSHEAEIIAAPETKAIEAVSSSPTPKQPTEPSEERQENPEQSHCQILPDGITLPHYISQLSIVLIGFQKTCVTKTGQAGFLPGSSWTAMGFPCTAGHGRIDKKGSDNIPSVVTFHLQNSCPMQPSRQDEVEQKVRQLLRLPADSHLIAYYPLSVDYWEFVDFSEHDIGVKPELFTPNGISQGWIKFSSKNEPLKLRIYGRENAWERAKQIFEVEAIMRLEGRSSFKLQVNRVRSLDETTRHAVSDRCEALRPKRNCAEVFEP